MPDGAEMGRQGLRCWQRGSEMPTAETSGHYLPKDNVLTPSGPAEVNSCERRVPGHGAFTTKKPRNDPGAIGGERVDTHKLSDTTTEQYRAVKQSGSL